MLISRSQIKNCWEAAWDIWPEVPKENPHSSDYVPDIYTDMDTDQKPIEAPEPFGDIIEQTCYADAAVFEAFPSMTSFERPMVIGESWPKEPKDLNAVRVMLVTAGIRARAFFFNPELK